MSHPYPVYIWGEANTPSHPPFIRDPVATQSSATEARKASIRRPVLGGFREEEYSGSNRGVPSEGAGVFLWAQK